MTLRTEKNYWQQDIKKKEQFLAAGKGAVIVLILGYLFYHSWIGCAALSPTAWIYYRMCIQECQEKKRREFEDQFRETLQSLVTALNVGYSIENALRAVMKEMEILYGKEAVIVRELSYMVRQLDMNLTVEHALRDFSNRVELEDVRTFVTVFVIAKRNGGDMIHILKNTIEKLCMKIEVKQEIDTLVAAKKMEFNLMSFIPIGIIIYMKISFAEFMSVLYGYTGGVIVMSVCLAIYMAAYYMGKNMLEIEV